MSGLEDQIEVLIKKSFPFLSYKKQQYIFYRNQKLFFDFIIPDLNVYIEVQGQQHYKRISFFHKFGKDFRSQKFRDQIKTEWCGVNDIILVSIKYSEINKDLTEESFRNKILKRVREFNDDRP